MSTQTHKTTEKTLRATATDEHGHEYVIEIRGESQESVERQFDILLRHEVAHHVAKELTMTWAKSKNFPDAQQVEPAITQLLADEPGDQGRHLVHLDDEDGTHLCAAMIHAPDEIRAGRMLLAMSHQRMAFEAQKSAPVSSVEA